MSRLPQNLSLGLSVASVALVGLSAAPVASGAVPSASSAPSAQTAAAPTTYKTAGSAAVTPASGNPNSVVAVVGKIPPYDTHPVTLQLLKGSTWVNVRATQSSLKGKFKIRTTLPNIVGTATFRVVTAKLKDPKTGKLVAYATPPTKATVVPVSTGSAPPSIPLPTDSPGL